MSLKEISLEQLKDINPFARIGKDWMLITAGTEEKFNTMTASWGALGVLWNKNVSLSFVRPQRYTFEFLENNEYYSLSFFDSQYKKELGFCGKVSGRDTDKIKETGFNPVFSGGAPCFEEANLVFICKKIYSQFIEPKCFQDENIDSNYPEKDYHKMFAGEIIKCMTKE